MNFNSTKTQNIIIVILVLAIILTFSIDAIQASIDRNSSVAIKERPPIKNTLKDYIVEKEEEPLYEIEVVEKDKSVEESNNEIIYTNEDYTTSDEYYDDYNNNLGNGSNNNNNNNTEQDSEAPNQPSVTPPVVNPPVVTPPTSTPVVPEEPVVPNEPETPVVTE